LASETSSLKTASSSAESFANHRLRSVGKPTRFLLLELCHGVAVADRNNIELTAGREAKGYKRLAPELWA
jgi:hypothetical protein